MTGKRTRMRAGWRIALATGLAVMVGFGACSRPAGPPVAGPDGSLVSATNDVRDDDPSSYDGAEAASGGGVRREAAAAAPAAEPAAPEPRALEQAYTPFAEVGGIVLVHPARLVERVGFHQSNHEGAQELNVASTAVRLVTLDSRERLTSPRSAADVVVDPNEPIVAPVSGKVLRAGSYVLYCKTTDDYVVIEPDGHPGWEVKVLHVTGEQVSPGQRLEAGVTPLAARSTPLPFPSQVDKLSPPDAPWPHVHIEVVDTSIPNVPNGGSGSSC